MSQNYSSSEELFRSVAGEATGSHHQRNMDFSLTELFSILETAEQVVLGLEDTGGADFVVPEPTPIAPGGIRSIITGHYGRSMMAKVADSKQHQLNDDFFSSYDDETVRKRNMNIDLGSSFSFSPTLESVRSSIEGPLPYVSSQFLADAMGLASSSTETEVASGGQRGGSSDDYQASNSSSFSMARPWEDARVDAIGNNQMHVCPRKFQAGQWNERFQDLMRFKDEHGHLLVPHSYPPNQKLAQWVKRYVAAIAQNSWLMVFACNFSTWLTFSCLIMLRTAPHPDRQRYQHRLKSMNRHSTLSDEREQILLDVGFIWDSHRAAWQDHFQSLEAFAMQAGNCNVPSSEMPTLSTWCKHQRRQYKNYCAGQDSTMTLEKIQCLEAIGFDWNPRGL
jgi:Helicase associated domain